MKITNSPLWWKSELKSTIKQNDNELKWESFTFSVIAIEIQLDRWLNLTWHKDFFQN